MIVASSQVNVAPELICVPTNDEQRLRMRFQADYSVDNVRARFLQTPRPLNIASFIKTRAQLDNSGHLFTSIGCVDQCTDNGRIAAGAIQRDLDGENLRIGCRFFNPLDYLIETVIRVVQQHVLASQYFEKISTKRQDRIARRLKRAVF